MITIQPVILAGGVGTRLWPLSRESYPKQFLTLNGEYTLLQQTWLRVADIADKAPIIVANDEYRFIVAEQMRSIGVEPSAILLEPVGRNTAPAIAVAALFALSLDEDPLLLVMPSDHVIEDEAQFLASIQTASTVAAQGKIVTFGMVPDRPETGYGYIQATAGEGIRDIATFVEKPELALAQQYLDDGGYLWNSGMFLLPASLYLEELELYHPEILAFCQQSLGAAKKDLDFIRLDKEAFSASPSLSIDYAVMEKTSKAAVMDVSIGWSDIGSYEALWQALPQDENGNVNSGDVVSKNCSNTLVLAPSRLVVTVGLNDIVVIDTDDALLVAHRDESQQIKKLVDELKTHHYAEATEHQLVYRPWGTYHVIEQGEGFKVKKITVKPRHSLSMQKHQHRAEHWVVVSGRANVSLDDQVIQLEANQSAYISPGVKHRLENPSDSVLEIIEIQTGEYLGEDDIVRFEDEYGRLDETDSY